MYIVALVIMAIAALSNAFLGVLALKRNSKKISNQWFFVIAALSSLIGVLNILLRLTGITQILPPIWGIGVALTCAGIIWVQYFVEGRSVSRGKILPFVFLAIFVFVITLLPGFLSNIHRVSPIVFKGQSGPWFIVMLAAQLFTFVYVVFVTNRYYRKAHGILRDQLRYTLFGMVGYGLLAITAGVVFTSIGFPNLAFLDSPSSLIWVGFTFYAIIRHRLLDIKVVLTRSIVYGVLITLVALVFISVLLLSAQFFNDSSGGRIAASIGIAILVVTGLDPLKRILSRITDKIFFQAKIDYTKLLQKLSSIISLELDLQKLIDDLEKGLVQGLKVKSSFILLRDRKDGKTLSFGATIEQEAKRTKITVKNESPLIQFVRGHQHLSLLEALERKIEDTPEGPARAKEEESRAEFERLGVALVAPVFSENHLVAVLTLGPKMSGDSFSNEDTQLIEVLAPQIGSAIQKANLYEEVRQFSAGLKVKVEEATKELRDRNVSLQTLQTITKDITRTLDFGKVVQNIANAVATELGFLGAILVFLDDDGKTLRSRAVTTTPLTEKALKLMPKPFSSYTTDITDNLKKNLAHEVIRTGQIQYTESMVEVISPPVPKPLVMAMQKVLGIKTMILVPIVSEQKVIGAIEVAAKQSRDQISQREIETIQSMADELGVVARNITLFDGIQKANAQLEVANKHLQELDRAKSEFVSIASHQLRTPMTGIMGYLSMMTQGDFGKIKPEHQKILVDLLAESQRMIRLINQFLNVSKIEAGKFTYTWKPTQLEDLVTHVVKEIEKPAADKGLKLTVKMPKEKLPLIQADADKIEDVVLNLIDNAIKYTAKGTVAVTVSPCKEGPGVCFAVKDSGIGIKPSDATELFSKFVRGSGIAQIHPDGSGLGLFIAKSIIDAHGGKIWAESVGENKGSTFQFVLPLTKPADLDVPLLNAAAHVTVQKK